MPEAERIWIMGASDGIGAALARVWAGRGARLVLSARSSDRLESLAAEIGGAELVAADTADPAAMADAAGRIAAGGPLDRAVTLAALYDPGRAMELDAARAARIVATNLAGSLVFAQTAVPLLRPGGQLALTGSVAGYLGLPQGQVYSATKAGVINLAETLRTELHGRADVRLICPGFVDTRLTQKNDFEMPGLMTPEAAAARIAAGLDRRGFEIHFPRRLTLPLKLLRAMPYALSLRLARRLLR
ncbi:SDR family NAD(P)-dependent oxidoreductase [Mangrovicoccus algicola]|uniref:SDR family NAD(P)-dependent oxidoreductase n=1 Tax=Mangrovicoccus algicola TaxID=2771008 RepID=A0A8J7CWB2_9RHOB|nr:SDR family NAD(P)-dependent oxidoreductase [Mangrovicoccus algicola]MBE3637557.1 SDR family NAD(P)-dependent oxidoreductase [Mangrovicoccus algicola]